MADLKAIIQQDLSRGTNVVANSFDIGQQQSVLITNMLLDEHGSVRTRDGELIITTSPDTAPSIRPIVKLYDYIQIDGTIIRLAIIRTIGGNNVLYNRATTPWTLIGTLGTDYAIPDILTFTNLALIANGYEVPWQYDGVTLQHITDSGGRVPAGAKHHALHQGYYWVWNTAISSGSEVAASFTTSFGGNADIVWTAVQSGAAGNAVSVEYVNDGANSPLLVTVAGNVVTIHLQTDGAGTPVSTASQIIAAVAASAAASTLIAGSLVAGQDGTGIPGVLAVSPLTGGSTTPSTLDGPSSLRSSALNKPSSLVGGGIAWPIANQIFVDKDDGDSGHGMGQFTIAETGISPTTTQVLFKTFSGYQMVGVFGSTTPLFSIQKIKSDMGCIAPRSIQFCVGYGLMRLTHRGFAIFDGVQDTLVSEAVRPLIFGNDVYEPIDWEQVFGSYACVVPNPAVYICVCPVCEKPGLSRMFCYDLVRQAWTILEYPQPIATLQSIEDPQPE